MIYRFDECELDTKRHQLRVGGKLRSVEPQVFDLLRYMAENPDRLISHDELIDNIWAGRIVSDSAVSARISSARSAIGDSGATQRMIKTVPRRGFQFTAKVVMEKDPSAQEVATNGPQAIEEYQKIRFCRSSDGTNIAFASTGSGFPLVRAGHWLTHLEHDWHSPIWRPFLNELGKSFRVTRYDQRGTGLSDWNIREFSLDLFTDDLAAVVDAAGIEKFALYGASQGTPIAINYALRHPERVSHLILHGGYHCGRLIRGSITEREQGEALLTLIRHGWGKAGSPFVQALSSTYVPGGTTEQIASLTELQKMTTSPENAAALREAVDRFNVSELLSEIDLPTLVIHADNDGVHPLDQGRELAAGIKGAEFVMLNSINHAPLQNEAAWQVMFDAIRRFIAVKD